MTRYRVASENRVVTASSAAAAHRASREGDMIGAEITPTKTKAKFGGAETVTRFVGNCQWCENDQKLFTVKPGEKVVDHDDLRMVHHGYKRPGVGHIVGDCPGVGELPYERSKVLVEHMLVGSERELARLREYLRELSAGEVTEIVRNEWDYRAGKYDLVTYVRASEEPWKWADVLRKEVDATERSIDYWAQRVEHLKKRVAGWVLKPARSFEEIAAKVSEEKAARKAVVEGKREAAREKRRAIDAKHAAREAKKQDFLAVARAELEAAAALPTKAEGRAAAEKTIERLVAKKSRPMFRYWDDLDADAALERLGYAKIDTTQTTWNPKTRERDKPYVHYFISLRH